MCLVWPIPQSEEEKEGKKKKKLVQLNFKS